MNISPKGVDVEKRITIELGSFINTKDDSCTILVEDIKRSTNIESSMMNLDRMVVKKDRLIHEKVMELLSHLECLQ